MSSARCSVARRFSGRLGKKSPLVGSRYGFIPLKSLRRVYDGIAIHLGPSWLRHRPLSSSSRIFPSFWWIAHRFSTARVSTANPAWIMPTTTFASRFSPAPHSPWPASSSVPRSSIATTGNRASSQRSCALCRWRRLLQRILHISGTKSTVVRSPSPQSGLSSTGACFHGLLGSRPASIPHSIALTAWSSSARSATSKAVSPSPTLFRPSALRTPRKSRRPSTASASMGLCAPAPACSPGSSMASIIACGIPKRTQTSQPTIPPRIWKANPCASGT